MLILVGLTFAGQGLGLIRGARSSMVDDPLWVVIGGAVAAFGFVVLRVSQRRPQA
ncbi:MAG TPA: hypothetical protein VGS17_05775 [Candidatus Limnocylindria bacterium]|nr:hypothetical protein [Candidatus Limnocylindria bacterium]